MKPLLHQLVDQIMALPEGDPLIPWVEHKLKRMINTIAVVRDYDANVLTMAAIARRRKMATTTVRDLVVGVAKRTPRPYPVTYLDPEVRVGILADYDAGMKLDAVAEKWKVSWSMPRRVARIAGRPPRAKGRQPKQQRADLRWNYGELPQLEETVR